MPETSFTYTLNFSQAEPPLLQVRAGRTSVYCRKLSMHRARLPLVILLLLVFASSQAQDPPKRIDSTRLSEYEEVYVAPETDTVLPAQESMDTDDDEEYGEAEEDQPAVVVRNGVRDRFLDNSIPEGRAYKSRGLGDEYRTRQKSDPEFWYADHDFGPKKIQQDVKPPKIPWWVRFFANDWSRVVLWGIIIGGFATLLIIYLRKNNAGLFRSTRRIDEVGQQADTEPDIFELDFNARIRKAEAAADYRLATRLHFLRLLRGLSDRNVISYKQDRTNLDYLMQLARGPHYNDFFRLARTYEYAWYGGFTIDNARYQLISNDFTETSKRFNLS